MNFNHFCEKRTIQLFILAIAITSAAILQRIIGVMMYVSRVKVTREF